MNPDAYIGQQIDLDGFPREQPYQCYDWANFWSNKNGYGRFTGLYAYNIFGQQPENYTWVKNSTAGYPPMGAIVVWDGGINNGPGHVAVARAGSDTNTLRTDDQNWGQPRVVPIDHNYSHVIGWGIPKNNQGENSMVIGNGENWYGRLNKLHNQVRGRDLDRATFNAFVGQDTLKFMEAVSDDPEADRVQNAQNVGTIAVRDKWDQQIYGLQDQLKNANDIVKALQDGDVVDKKTISDLQKEIDKLKEPTPPTQGFEPSKPVVTRSLLDKIINLIKEGRFE